MYTDITVIIPVFNVEEYLVQCLESVVHQSVTFDEVILVNDGSTDNSVTICERYIHNYSYFKLINQENRGLSVARNVGIRYASSQYIMFLDSDDYLRNDAVEILKRKLQKGKYEAIYFDADIRGDEKYNAVKRNIYDRKNVGIDKKQMNGWEYFLKCYPYYFVVSACMAVYLKETIDRAEIIFPEGMYFEDNYFSIAFINRATKVIHISEKLYQRRYRKNSITVSEYSEKKFLDFMKVSLLVKKELDFIKNFEEIEKVEIRFKVASEYLSLILNNYELCNEQEIILSSDTKKILKKIMRQYVYSIDREKLDFTLLGLPLLNKVMSNLNRICLLKDQYNIEVMQTIKKIVRFQKKLFAECLKDLQLNFENVKIGIYGTGKHTEGMLAIYEKLFGEIKCDLVFIDSYKSSGLFRSKNIINYHKIDESFDLIIISSYFYEKEMRESVKSVMPNSLIYTFYDIYNEDIFSLYDNYIRYF